MLKLIKLKSVTIFMVQYCHFKTHNTLNPFINRSTSNDGWAFSPQAAISPVCTPTREKKNPLIQVLKGKEGIHNPLMLTKYIYCVLGQESQMPESLRLNLAQEMQMCDATTNVMGGKCAHV